MEAMGSPSFTVCPALTNISSIFPATSKDTERFFRVAVAVSVTPTMMSPRVTVDSLYRVSPSAASPPDALVNAQSSSTADSDTEATVMMLFLLLFSFSAMSISMTLPVHLVSFGDYRELRLKLA